MKLQALVSSTGRGTGYWRLGSKSQAKTKFSPKLHLSAVGGEHGYSAIHGADVIWSFMAAARFGLGAKRFAFRLGDVRQTGVFILMCGGCL
jgi:hypothetical protein